MKQTFGHCIPYFLDLLLEQTLREQSRLVKAKHAHNGDSRYDPIIEDLGDLALEIHLWSQGRSPVSDPLVHFRKRCEAVEAEANHISQTMWRANCLDLVSIIDYAEQEHTRFQGTFGFMLRSHHDIQRMRLLDQVKGARLLQNNSDLGDEVERIFVEYLSQNLGPELRVVRGGHIFSSSGARSKQMDILVVPSGSFAMCPADTEDGKHNILIDQVVATISVKSTLTQRTFESAWRDIQSIPEYTEKDSAHSYIEGQKHAWPLTFVASANCMNTHSIDEEWSRLCALDQRHQLQMWISLDKGYSIAGNSSWPLIAFHDEEYRGPFSGGNQLRAGLGLAWLLLSIAARRATIDRRDLSVFKKQRELIREAEMLTGCGSPTSSYHHKASFKMCQPISGVVRWDSKMRWIHNELFAGCLNVNGTRLVNSNVQPSQGTESPRPVPRWFEYDSLEITTQGILLREWRRVPGNDAYEPINLLFDPSTGESTVVQSDS